MLFFFFFQSAPKYIPQQLDRMGRPVRSVRVVLSSRTTTIPRVRRPPKHAASIATARAQDRRVKAQGRESLRRTVDADRTSTGYAFPAGQCAIRTMNCSGTSIPAVDLRIRPKQWSAHSKRPSDYKHQRCSVYDERFGVHCSTRRGASFIRITAH